MARMRSTQKLPRVLRALRAAAAGQPARQGERHADTGGGRGEVVPGETRHLREVAHGGLAASTTASWCWW